MHVAHSGANSGSETIKTLRMTALDYRLLRLARCLLMQADSLDHPFWKMAHPRARQRSCARAQKTQPHGWIACAVSMVARDKDHALAW